jgi:four helix bundle protein
MAECIQSCADGLGASREFPRQETYGLSIQMRRAAVSVVSNIAEGKGRNADRELLRFLSNSRGSLFELQTQIDLAKSLNYLNECEKQCSRFQGERDWQVIKRFAKNIPIYHSHVSVGG